MDGAGREVDDRHGHAAADDAGVQAVWVIPTANGVAPTGIAVPTVFVATSTGVSVPSPTLRNYTFRPSGVTVTPSVPTVLTTVVTMPSFMSIIARPPPLAVTYARRPSGVTATLVGAPPMCGVRTTVPLTTSKIETVPSRVFGTMA
jgi:hypothetical protein